MFCFSIVFASILSNLEHLISKFVSSLFRNSTKVKLFHWIIYTYKLKWAKVFNSRKWFCFKMSFFAVFCQSGNPNTVPSVTEICGYWEISSTGLYRISPLIGSSYKKINKICIFNSENFRKNSEICCLETNKDQEPFSLIILSNKSIAHWPKQTIWNFWLTRKRFLGAKDWQD